MTDPNLERVLKNAIAREYEIISRATRRKNVLTHYQTRLRLGKHPDVVRAEIAAADETIELSEEGEPWSRDS